MSKRTQQNCIDFMKEALDMVSIPYRQATGIKNDRIYCGIRKEF